MSCAYQYGVETTPQPAASAKVSAPDEICSRCAVGRHEYVGRCEEIGDLVDAEEPVVELDVILEAEVEHGPLERQAVPLALAMRDVRVRPSGDHVHHVRMPFDDRGQRLDHGLEALALRDQAERREQKPVVEPPGRTGTPGRLVRGRA